jgi:TP901 family phage tail tape measure protein
MTNLPKAGVMLVAEGVTKWLSQINESNKAMTDFAVSTTNAANQINNIPTTGIDNAGNAVSKFADNAANSKAKAGMFQEVWTGALRQVGGFATQKMMEAGGAILKFATDAPKLAGDFQAKFNQILAVGGEEVAKNEDAIRKLIIKVGKELPISTNDAADAYANLLKGGFDPATLAAGTYTDTLQFALGANLELATAADLVAKQVGSFVPAGASAAEQAKFAAEAMDIMTQVANTSTTDVAGLSGGLLQAGGTAKAVGLTYKEFVMTMGAISNAFGSSAEAGTGFKNFLVRLSPTTKEAQDTMTRLGLFSLNTSKMMTFLTDQGVKPLGTDMATLTEQVAKYLKESEGLSKAEIAKSITTNFGSSAFYDAQGNLKSMAEISGILGDSLKNLTNEQKGQALQQIFGNDAMQAAVKLADLGTAGMDEFAKKMEKANGVQKQYDAAMKGATFASDNFEGTLEAIQITLGTYILPYIEQFYTYVNELASSFLTLFDDKKTLNDIIPPGLIEAVQPLIVAFDDVQKIGMEMWGELSTIFADLGDLLGIAGTDGGDALVGTFKFISEAIRLILIITVRTIADTIKGLRVILEAPAVKFVLVTLVTAFRVMYEAVAGIMEVLNAVFTNDMGKIPGIINTHMAAITAIFDRFDVYFYQQWDALVVWFAGVWNEIGIIIMTAIEPILISVGMWIMGIKETIISTWNSIVSGVMYVLDNFWTLVAQYFINYAFNLGRALRTIYDIIIWTFTTAWDAVVFIFTDAGPLIDKALTNLGKDLDKWLKTTGDSIAKGFATGWAKVVKMFENAWADTKDALATFPGDFTKWLDTTWATLKKSFASIWDGKTVGKSVTTGILDGLKANVNFITEWMSALGQSIIDAFLAGLTTKVEEKKDEKKDEKKTVKTTATTQAANELSKSINATANAAAFGAVRSMVTNIYNNSNATAYNLGVSTTASAGDTIQSFAIMGALAS